MEITITGVGSVGPHGPRRGLIPAGTAAARPPRVAPFRPAAVVSGLKTRKLDRLSVWGLVASALAVQDAGIDPAQVDGSRVAVVLGTGFGCLETTEAYFRTVAACGYAHADPILFPDSLDNSPAGHVARHFGFSGPNITLSCRGVSGEAALIQAAGLLCAGEADMAVALAGDTLTRPLEEWYAAARCGFVPGEGMAAVVMERGERGYVKYVAGAMGADPGATAAGFGPDTDILAKKLVPAGWSPRVVSSDRPQIGHFDGNGILALVAALSDHGIPAGGLLLCGVSAGGGRAAVLFGPT